MFNLARHFQNAVQPLVLCALDRDPAQRRAWLNELRADCPSVSHEVERLLALALGADADSDYTFTGPDLVPGSPEYLGLRC